MLIRSLGTTGSNNTALMVIVAFNSGYTTSFQCCCGRDALDANATNHVTW